MELKGTVLNVVDFGAFIDIGLKDSGLVHISQMANRYVKSPYDVVAVGDVVTVWVLAVDKERRRVSLTMIQPGTERKPPEKKPTPPRREGPPRGERRPPQEGRGPQDGRSPTAGRRAGRNRGAVRRKAEAARNRAAVGAGCRRAAFAVRRPASSRAGAGQGSKAAERRRKPRQRNRPPRRGRRAVRRRSRTCRKRLSPVPRRSALSRNWPRSGTQRSRKIRRAAAAAAAVWRGRPTAGLTIAAHSIRGNFGGRRG